MPKRDSPNVKDFAKQLLALESLSPDKSEGADGDAAFRICEKLRVLLQRLMGAAGFRALFSRALALAGEDVAWLRGLHIQASGALEGLAELKPKLSDEQMAAGEIALVTELLELLVTFIGPALTLQLLREAWPNADFSRIKL
jgi:nicotinic acid phosphoribosyltransferase